MGSWAVAFVALALVVYAAGSAMLARRAITAALFFTAAGLLAGPALGIVDEGVVRTEQVRLLAELTLTLVLFADASRISIAALRGELGIPVRLLGIGLPLTILAGTAAGIGVLPGISVTEAALLATMLACTDAALGQAVVVDERVPARIRQSLNVESGLNDGLCVPIFLALLAATQAEESVLSASGAVELVGRELGFGALGGVLAGICGAAALRAGVRSGAIATGWVEVLTAGTAFLAAGIATGLGGSIFIAAFVAGVVFGVGRRNAGGEVASLVDEAGGILGAVTFVVFGAAILGPVLGSIGWEAILYAVLSLTVVRMAPVAIALLGTGARPQTVAFLGWFGPRGLASIVFGVLLVEEPGALAGESTLLLAVIVTVALSVVGHGLSAAPLTERYVAWLAAHPRGERPLETAPATVPPPRWGLGGDGRPPDRRS
ncbi:MAG: cation:proton antiporter [Gaiella sp.]